MNQTLAPLQQLRKFVRGRGRRLPGDELRLLNETATEPMDLADGQLVNLELPLFVYVPTAQSVVVPRPISTTPPH